MSRTDRRSSMSAESHPTACGHRLCSHAAPKYQQHISLRSLSTTARSVRPATARSWQNSRPLQLSIAATSSRGLEAWAGHQGPAQSCSALRTPGRSRCQAAAGKPRGRLIRASAARQRTVELQRGRTRRGTPLETGLGGHWCWAWESSRWRASLFFLLASISFFVGSSAAMFEPVASDALTNNLLVVYPYAAGSVLYMLGAQLYKRSAFEGLHRARRCFSAFHPACAWARTEVKGTHAIVTGCRMGVLSTASPILLQIIPLSVLRQVPLDALDLVLTTALNVASGFLFVCGSYVILGSMYHSLAPGRVFARPNLDTFAFWGSACYLVGSTGLLLGAVLTQPIAPVPPGLNRLGHFVGYVIGSLWFVAGALAQIADVARERRLETLTNQ